MDSDLLWWKYKYMKLLETVKEKYEICSSCNSWRSPTSCEWCEGDCCSECEGRNNEILVCRECRELKFLRIPEILEEDRVNLIEDVLDNSLLNLSLIGYKTLSTDTILCFETEEDINTIEEEILEII